MIKEEIQLRYFNRTTKQICNEQENNNDFVLVSMEQERFCEKCLHKGFIIAEWHTRNLYQYRIKSPIQRRRI